MHPILILKTAALGDVLRTSSILPGLAERYPGCPVVWVTAPGAVDLVRLHPLVSRVVTLDVCSRTDAERVRAELATTTWERILSFDDEEPLCRLASSLRTLRLSGACLGRDGRPAYTPDTAPWFDMGLLSVHGKFVADRLKRENEKSHALIFAEMLGVAPGKPHLPREPHARRTIDGFLHRQGLVEDGRGPWIGLNTGAGGRWNSKALPEERVVELTRSLDQALGGKARFLVLGGREEAQRNRRILEALSGLGRVADGGTDHALLDFAELVSRCDVLLTSDSLALHVAIAREVRVVAFFAPTSAAEIDVFGHGEKVASQAADYCSYKPDADTSTLSVERLQAAVLRQLALVPDR